MAKPAKFWLLCFQILILAGCGSTEPEQVDEIVPAPDNGAGSVMTVDAALEALVPVDYRIEKLHGDFVFTEGPVWVTGDGPYLLFSDVPGNVIYKWSPNGELSDYMNPVFDGEKEGKGSVGSNGLTIDSEERLVICEHGNRRISRIENDGTQTVLVDNYQGKRLNSPNDVALKSDGWLYFTDPPYGLAKLEEDPERDLDFNGIFRLSPTGEIELLNGEQTRPNGIAFSPDEQTLYVANSDEEEKVWMAYDVKEDGTIANGRVFFDVTSESAEGLPDGLKVDTSGNVFATGPGGVWIFDPSGKHLGTIQPDEVPANVAWGDDGRTLYMTARTSLYSIRLNTRGTIP